MLTPDHEMQKALEAARSRFCKILALPSDDTVGITKSAEQGRDVIDAALASAQAPAPADVKEMREDAEYLLAMVKRYSNNGERGIVIPNSDVPPLLRALAIATLPRDVGVSEEDVERVARAIVSAIPGTGDVDEHMQSGLKESMWLPIARAAVAAMSPSPPTEG